MNIYYNYYLFNRKKNNLTSKNIIQGLNLQKWKINLKESLLFNYEDKKIDCKFYDISSKGLHYL